MLGNKRQLSAQTTKCPAICVIFYCITISINLPSITILSKGYFCLQLPQRSGFHPLYGKPTLESMIPLVFDTVNYLYTESLSLEEEVSSLKTMDLGVVKISFSPQFCRSNQTKIMGFYK